ncbi:MAG: hypothetical protein CW341_03290 [Bacteroidetes bacterium]|nr:hypothetical protein [Bacteroidota bacterium]
MFLELEISVHGRSVDLIEQKKGTCKVIKCKKDAEDGKVMEVIHVFKEKRMWTIGLFRDSDKSGISHKVIS